VWNNYENIEEWVTGAQSTVDVPDQTFEMATEFLDSSAFWMPDEAMFLDFGDSSFMNMEHQSQLDFQAVFEETSIICYGMVRILICYSQCPADSLLEYTELWNRSITLESKCSHKFHNCWSR
jgi:hypothetical protein